VPQTSNTFIQKQSDNVALKSTSRNTAYNLKQYKAKIQSGIAIYSTNTITITMLAIEYQVHHAKMKKVHIALYQEICKEIFIWL